MFFRNKHLFILLARSRHGISQLENRDYQTFGVQFGLKVHAFGVAAAVFLLKLNSDSEGAKTQICYLKAGA